MRQVICLLAVFSLLALTGAMAQTGVDGAILGVVSDANGGVIAGASHRDEARHWRPAD